MKGTSIKAIKEAIGCMKTAVEGLTRRSVSEETLALQTENRLIRAQLRATNKRLQEVSGEVEALRSQCSGHRVPESPARKEEAMAEHITRSVIAQVGKMLDARFVSHEDRLLPAQVCRQQLAVDRKLGKIKNLKPLGGSASTTSLPPGSNHTRLLTLRLPLAPPV